MGVQISDRIFMLPCSPQAKMPQNPPLQATYFVTFKNYALK
ncbi:hypothetical protein ADIS_0817 [Lunatimonas lonarensis]|uniref:Uncharacterized protein n=1 Tax=Lunatimonas lonarensis TaxID=1232681 RepID=R7ZXB2_9BACT|nr:hypothetical protein ADIS_0817 [Lunatimonas lonarensis]